MKEEYRRALGGGGNRCEARDIIRKNKLAAKQFGSEAAKFLKDDRTIRRKDDKSKTEAIRRHSERLAKESSDTNNLIQLQGIKINSTETGHASKLLGIFASKSVSCWHGNANLHKKFAFTLAEVLITLGIIGVVAALTLPSVIQNYQEKQLTTAWKKAYSDVANATLLMSQNNEDLSTEQKVGEAFARYLQIDKVCEAHKGIEQGCWRRGVYISKKGGGIETSDPTGYGGGAVCMLLTSGTTFCIDNGGNKGILYFDVNGINKPNTYGKDIFFAIFNHEKYAIKPAKGRRINWGAADCYWITCTTGNGTCDGDDLGYGCSAEKLLK